MHCSLNICIFLFISHEMQVGSSTDAFNRFIDGLLFTLQLMGNYVITAGNINQFSYSWKESI